MRIRSFIIAYALLLAILLFADRRPNPAQQNHYSHIVDLTLAENAAGPRLTSSPRTQIIAPDALIPGTWAAGQIPPERLIAPLVVMDLNVAPPAQISLDDIANWESAHGSIPQGAVVAIRHSGAGAATASASALPITDDAAQFLMDARYILGFAVESQADIRTNRPLARQLALHGNYVVERTSLLTAIPATGSLIIVAPAKNKNLGTTPVRVLAMVR
jgi:kynurenine formamidase